MQLKTKTIWNGPGASYRQYQRLFEVDQLEQLFQAYENIAQQQPQAHENVERLQVWESTQPLEPTALYEWARQKKPQKQTTGNMIN